ncbi:MAG TPA: alpha/beta hydrolase [Ignavibacteriaceae bacterium]|nr:alpha/beta hydrolase [Ignavibacteriaceae bacterium]
MDSSIPYGNNKDAGHFALINGVKIYFEVYGKGEPLILIHGNGGNIAGMKYQAEYFSGNYTVIIPDCRGRGKSELGNEQLTYMQMTEDLASLMDHLQYDAAYIAGRSDGGIIGLMMGIYFPLKVKKIAAFGANLWPGKTALYPAEVESTIKIRKHAEEMIAKNDKTQDWNLVKQRFRLMETQPHITSDDLKKIEAPVLVMSCDRDLILEEHTLFIYRNIPKSNLCIFPGETHWVTNANPELFNSTVDKFFSEPFKGEEIRK